jgi:hypothetical protein
MEPSGFIGGHFRIWRFFSLKIDSALNGVEIRPAAMTGMADGATDSDTCANLHVAESSAQDLTI